METNYDEVYEVICKYYPIGIKPSNPLYGSFSGSILFDQLLSERLAPPLFPIWKSMVKELKKENPEVKETDHESPLFYPCYSGKLVLHKEIKGILSYKREIVFHLSFLGPYYSIYGLDRAFINAGTKEAKEFGPIIYVSPMEIYEPYFMVISEKIKAFYEGYKFLSHRLLSDRVNALITPNTSISDANSTVFQALFTPNDITTYKTYGNPWYEE